MLRQAYRKRKMDVEVNIAKKYQLHSTRLIGSTFKGVAEVEFMTLESVF